MPSKREVVLLPRGVPFIGGAVRKGPSNPVSTSRGGVGRCREAFGTGTLGSPTGEMIGWRLPAAARRALLVFVLCLTRSPTPGEAI